MHAVASHLFRKVACQGHHHIRRNIVLGHLGEALVSEIMDAKAFQSNLCSKFAPRGSGRFLVTSEIEILTLARREK